MSDLLAPPPLGRITTETAEQYHGQPCVSASKLRTFNRRPGGAWLYFLTYIAKAIEKPETVALREGRAAHTLVFEPAKFEAEYASKPEDMPTRQSNAGKAAHAAFDAAHKGKCILTHDNEQLARTVAASVRSHRSASQLIAKGEPEITFRMKAQGLPSLPPLQCRPDWLNTEGCELSEGRPYAIDLKTCATLDRTEYGNFFRGAKELSYDMQFGLYMAILGACGVEVRDFFVIAAEKCIPHGVEVFRMTDKAIEQGQRKAEELLVRLAECYRSNTWPNTEGGVQELTAATFKYGRNGAEDAFQ